MVYIESATVVVHLVILAIGYFQPGKQNDSNIYEKNKAFNVGRSNLNRIKINVNDALEMEKELNNLLYFNPKSVMQHIPDIPIQNVAKVLENYDGTLTKTDRKKIVDGINVSGENIDKVIDMKFDANEVKNSKIRYGLVAHCKSKDDKFVDLLIAVYEVEFKVKNKVFSAKETDRLENFFRYKALKDFKTEGLID